MTRFDNLFGATSVAGLTLASLLLSASTAALAQTAPPPAKKPAPAAAPAQLAPAAPQAAAPAAKPAASSGNDADVVARAGDNNLTRDDVRTFVSTLSPAEQAALARDPALFSQTLRMILANQLILKEALTKKWQDTPAISAQLEKVRENAIVETYLQSVSAMPKEFPSEGDLRKAYDANQAALTLPRQFKVAQIFVTSPENADKDTAEKAKKKLADIQGKLKQPGSDFAAVAKSDSDERLSADRGGEIGWLSETQLRPEIKPIVIGLAKGGISEPISVPGGWHIVKVIDTKDAGPAAFEDVREPLAQRLRAQAAESNRRAYMAKLLDQSPPSINELALSSVLDLSKVEAAAK
jgi:parvulin-like peptidyl-prolyl isomerase